MPSNGSRVTRGRDTSLMRRNGQVTMSEDNSPYHLLFSEPYYDYTQSPHVTNAHTDDSLRYITAYPQYANTHYHHDIDTFKNMSPTAYVHQYSPNRSSGQNVYQHSSDVDGVAKAFEYVELTTESPIGNTSILTCSQETSSMPHTPADDPPLDFDFPTNLKNFPSVSAAGSALFPNGLDGSDISWTIHPSQPPRQQKLTVDTTTTATNHPFNSDASSAAPPSATAYGPVTAPHTAPPVYFQRALGSPSSAQVASNPFVFSPSIGIRSLGLDGYAINQGSALMSQTVSGFSHAQHPTYSLHAGAHTDRWNHSNAQLPSDSIESSVPPPSSAPAQFPDPSFQFFNHARQLTPLHEGRAMDTPNPSPPAGISPQVLTSPAVDLTGPQPSMGPSRAMRIRPSPSPYQAPMTLPPIERFTCHDPTHMRLVLQNRIEELAQSPKARNSKEDEVYLQEALMTYADVIVKFGEHPHTCASGTTKNGARAKESRTDKNKPGSFVCFYCAQDITSKQNLFKHLKSVHLKLKSVQCDQCGASLAGDLSRHKRTCQKF